MPPPSLLCTTSLLPLHPRRRRTPALGRFWPPSVPAAASADRCLAMKPLAVCNCTSMMTESNRTRTACMMEKMSLQSNEAEYPQQPFITDLNLLAETNSHRSCGNQQMILSTKHRSVSISSCSSRWQDPCDLHAGFDVCHKHRSTIQATEKQSREFMIIMEGAQANSTDFVSSIPCNTKNPNIRYNKIHE